MADCYKLYVALHSRSGGRFMANVLRHFGMRVGHEYHDWDGIVSWLHIGWGVVPWLKDPVQPGRYEIIIHQVRHPLDVISSAAFTEAPFALEFMQANAPELPRPWPWWGAKERIAFYMLGWVAWNKRIEALGPAYRYRIENLREEWLQLRTIIGSPVSNHPLACLSEAMTVPRNSRRERYKHRLTWADLEKVDSRLAARVREMGERYGYAG